MIASENEKSEKMTPENQARGDAVLKRMLNTPPQPKTADEKTKDQKPKDSVKPTQNQKLKEK